MDRYIEVLGEGRFVETAKRFIAEVTLEVRAARDETALQEVAELCAEALAALRQAGIADEDVVEGGVEVHRPWYSKKQVGQCAARKIILKVVDFARLNRALERLEPLQARNRERRTIDVQMRQPEFEDDGMSQAKALSQAVRDAQSKAAHVASAMQCTLGRPLQVEEEGWTKRNSGFTGDEDFSGDSSRFSANPSAGVLLSAPAAAPSPSPSPAPEPHRPTRAIIVRCRVRFELLSPAASPPPVVPRSTPLGQPV